MPRLSTFTDRRGTNTTFAYPTASETSSDRGAQRQVFKSIDSSGRVGEITAGDTSGTVLHQTLQSWDTAAAPCRQPDNAVDNNLCRRVRKALGQTVVAPSTVTPDEDTSFLYNPEGQLLRERRANGATNLDTTYGYAAQYARSGGGATVVVTDTVAGAGNVTSGSRPADPTQTLYALSDRRESLPPRGNASPAPPGGFASYRTEQIVEADPTKNPNRAVTSCMGFEIGNTGLVCEQRSPSWDESQPGLRATTRFTYDNSGQRATMTSPKAMAETTSGTPPSTTYTYYLSGDRDLSGSVSIGGWLKGVTDPTGKFVAFAYDRAGNVVRTWDRNATQGSVLSVFPGTADTPTNTRYTEQAYGTGTGSAPFAAPWRSLRSSRDQLGNRSSFTVDANGNGTAMRSPRGNAAGDATYDTTQTFDANDNLLTQLRPEEASADKRTRFVYDAFDNPTSETDPNGNVTIRRYDAVNRLVRTAWSRSADATQAPAACPLATAADAPIATGRYVCSTTSAYDMVDNVVSVTDADGQRSDASYDAVHREIRRMIPRNAGGLTMLRSERAYDLDGRVTDTCPPREFTETNGAGACTLTAPYSQHARFDYAGRPVASTTYRTPGAANTTTVGYDADGNETRTTDANGRVTTRVFNVLDRKVSETTPRDAVNGATTFWEYDAAGNTTAVIRPDGTDMGTGADGDLVVDGAQYPRTSPFVIPAGKNYRNVTLQNGGWIAGAPFNGSAGGRLEFKATGTVNVCSTCGGTVAGPGGGQGGQGQGPSYDGWGGAGWGAGGGGGAGFVNGSGGGGAGHASAGSPGLARGTAPGAAGTAGGPYGATDLSDSGNGVAGMGSGGGGGGAGNSMQGGVGGGGGGVIRVTAQKIVVAGTLSTDATPGANAQNYPTLLGDGGGGGGGGSGGSVWLTAPEIALDSTSALSVRGASGGLGNAGSNGGTGANGRVRLDAGTVTGSGAAGDGRWGSSYRGFLGRITAYSYDDAHRPVDTVQGADRSDASQSGVVDGAGGRNVRSRVAYDPDGNVVARYEPRAFASSTTTPDARFMVRSEFDRNGRQVAQYVPRYDQAGAANVDLGSSTQTDQCRTDTRPAAAPSYPAGVGVCVTRVEYDAAGNALKVTLPTSPGSGSSGRYVAYAYTDDDRIQSLDAPSPTGSGRAVSRFVYDGNGRELKRTDALGLQQTTSYTSDGLVKDVTGQPAGTVTHVTAYGYDANGNRMTVTDPSGQVSRTAYFADNRVSEVTTPNGADPAGDRTAYLYDGVGNPTQVTSPSAVARDATNPSGTPTVNTYSFDNLLLATTVPVSGDGSVRRRTTYGYDRGGRKTTQATDKVNAGGGVLEGAGAQSFAYHPNDRLAAETGRNGAGTISYGYDPAGNRSTIADSSGSTLTTSYYLDGLERSVNDGSRTTLSTYDGAGAPAARADELNGTSTRHITRYSYGDAGLPSSMASNVPSTNASFLNTTWTYDAGGRPLTEVAPNGQRTEWTYNNDDTLARQLLKNSAGAWLSDWNYAYDNNYRQVTQTHAGPGAGGGAAITGTATYAYDPSGRLSSYTEPGKPAKALSWDHDGNRLSFGAQRFTYNADDSIATATDTTGANQKSFTYAAFGGVSSDGCTTYAYDGFDRMTRSAGQAAQACPTPVTKDYAYDGLDRQRSHKKLTDLGPTVIHYDGLGQSVAMETAPTGIDTVFELDASGKAKASKVNTVVAPKVEYLADDGYGNVTTVTSSSAAVDCTVRYDPFGNANAPQASDNPCHTGSKPASDLFYRGTRRDDTTGQYQMGFRSYDPAKGTFLTPDAYRSGTPEQNLSVKVDPLTQNTYSYVNGDPVNLIDPDGHEPCEAAGGGELPACKADVIRVYQSIQQRRAKEAVFKKFVLEPLRKGKVPHNALVEGREWSDWERRAILQAAQASCPVVATLDNPKARRCSEGWRIKYTRVIAGEVLQSGGRMGLGSLLKNVAYHLANFTPGVGEGMDAAGCLGGDKLSCAALLPVLGTFGDAAQSGRRAARAIGPAGNAGAFPRLSLDQAQVQAKFKHAADFGVAENAGSAGFEAYSKSLEDFMAAPGTVRGPGSYRGQSAILNFDPYSRLVVVQRPNGAFWSGWRMSEAQLMHVLERGSLGGG